MVEKKPLEGLKVSQPWFTELLELGKEGPDLPLLKKPITSSEIIRFLRRPDVEAAINLPREDIDYTIAFTDLGKEHRRRVGVSLDPYKYDVALAMMLEERTGLSLRPCGKIRNLPSHHLRHHMGGRIDERALDEADAILFSEEVQRPGWREYYSRELSKVSGACTDEARSQMTVVGSTLDIIEDVGFFRVKVDDEFAACQLSALSNDPAKGVTVPIVGEFMDENGTIPDERLRKWGLERVRDRDGKPLRYPMFAHTHRSLMEFCHTWLYVPVVDGRIRIVNKPEVVLDIIRDVAGEPFVLMAKRTAELLVNERFQRTGGADYEEFKKTQAKRALIDAGMGILQQLPHPEIRRRVKIRSIPVCAIQYKGVGGEYHGHYTRLPEEDVGKNPNLRFVERMEDKDSFVVDRRIEGTSGIYLTTHHQEGSRDPVGGTATLEALGYEREQMILDNGGFLSGITVGRVKLLDRKQVPNMPVKEVGVAIVAIIDDTRRIEMFFAEKDEIKSDDYKTFVVERYAPPKTAPKKGMDEYIDEHFEKCRHKHLSEFFSKLGATMKGTLGSNLTNPRDQNIMNNISVLGGITDTRALAEMTDQNQAAGLIRGVVCHLDSLGRAAGYEPGGIFKTKYFQQMAVNLLGRGAGKVLEYVDDENFSTGKNYDNWVQSTKIVGLMTDAWVESRGQKPSGAYHMSDIDFLKLMKDNKQNRKRAHLSEENLELYLQTQRMTRPMVDRVGVGVIPLELALERHRAAFEDRMDKTPSIYENARAIEAKYWKQ